MPWHQAARLFPWDAALCSPSTKHRLTVDDAQGFPQGIYNLTREEVELSMPQARQRCRSAGTGAALPISPQ